MERNHFYQIPESIEQHPYLRWQIDPRLRRYIHQRIPDNYLPIQILATAQILVAEVQTLELDRQRYTLPERNLSGSITALLAHILFAKRKARLVRVASALPNRMVEILKHHFQGTELRDVYQISLTVISHPAKFLRNFQPQVDWYVSLGWYSHNRFQKSLTDELRRLAGDNFKRTNLGLLNRCSPFRLETVLKQSIQQTERRESLLLLHQCFQEIVIAKKFSTNNPQPDDYDVLLTRYRSLKQATDLEIVDRDMVKALLTDLSNLIRHDRQQIERSLDAPLSPDRDAGTVGDLIADPHEQISIEHREMRELALDLLHQSSLIWKTETLSNRQSATGKLADSILFLRYGLGLTQTEAGLELDCNQSTIGRNHDRQIAKLAREFYLKYHKLPATTQMSIEILAEYSQYIESLCADYYVELAIDLLPASLENMAKSSDLPQQQLRQQIETRWEFSFKPGGAGLSRIDAFVRQRAK